MTPFTLSTHPNFTPLPTPLIPINTILDQFYVPTSPPPPAVEEITMATVGTNRVVITEDERYERQENLKKPTFDPIDIQRRKGPLVIYDKRWYFRLVPPKPHEYQRARALMQDFPLNQLVNHLVICFTPDHLPNSTKPFRKPDGDPIRIYAYFDSYLEFYQYQLNFEPEKRAFYEIIFGELPQKPHFDIDIDRQDFNTLYPGEDIDQAADLLRNAVIAGSVQVLSEKGVALDPQKDILLYTSHGPNKRSYHVVITNKCHDGNREAKAFYDLVMMKVNMITDGKYLDFVDASVYSPRQQFRIVGCQKQGSNRPKEFQETFRFQDNQQDIIYTHVYPEDATEPIMRELAILYESLVGFTSGCVLLPSLAPPKPIHHHNLGDLPDLDGTTTDHCLNMLREKMPYCPFSINAVQGHLILLKRHAPSHCPICQKTVPHEKENPFMFVVGGKVYWDCRRCPDEAKRFFVGYLAFSMEELQTGTFLPGMPKEESSDDEKGGEFMFGDFDIGAPTLTPLRKSPPKLNSPKSPKLNSPTLNNPPPPPETLPKDVPTIFYPPPERRLQGVVSNVTKTGKDWTQRPRKPRPAKSLTGAFMTIGDEGSWDAGYHK